MPEPSQTAPPSTPEAATDVPRPPLGLSANARGAIWLVSAALCFSVMGGLVKHLGQDLNALQIIFFRCAMGLLVLLPLGLRQSGLDVFKTTRVKLYFLRVFLGTVTMFLLFYAITVLPLAMVTSLNFSRPLWLILLAIPFLGEVVGWRRGIATVVGFIGVLVVMRPDLVLPDLLGGGPDRATWGTIAAAGSAFTVAAVVVTLKKLSSTENSMTMLIWFAIGSSLVSLPPALYVWEPISPEQLVQLFLVGVLGTVGQFFMYRAYRVGETTVITPFDYFQILFAGIIGFVFFSEIPGPDVAIGALLIVGSTFYILRREANVRRQQARAAAGPSADGAVPPEASNREDRGQS